MYNPNDLLAGYVLDESGSMGGYAVAAAQAFNEFKHSQANQAGTAYITLTTFNTQIKPRYVAEDARNIPDMTWIGSGHAYTARNARWNVNNLGQVQDIIADGPGPNLYAPGGGTALYDAVGVTVKGLEQWLANHPSFTGKVQVTIWTDGMENASRSWHIDALNSLITEKQNQGWVFLFLGTGGAAWTEGNKFTAIPQINRVYTPQSDGDYALIGSATSASVSNLRSKGTLDNSAYSNRVN